MLVGLLCWLQTFRYKAGITGSPDIAFGKLFIYTQALLKVAVHAVAERFAVSGRHVPDLAFDPVEQGVHTEHFGLLHHLLIGVERITIFPFTAQLSENPLENLPVEMPFEETPV